ncbi:hypothetical protein E2C01_019080 [Portunus trituberculatus]|uniref:Uncharacterized protein n=1 Tax=Portunus trituberculatus TaxID=210409 RepID=A0A5B7DY79_PORTR|nr:hypothetical protein [Portunus trituberculatus]
MRRSSQISLQREGGGEHCCLVFPVRGEVVVGNVPELQTGKGHSLQRFLPAELLHSNDNYDSKQRRFIQRGLEVEGWQRDAPQRYSSDRMTLRRDFSNQTKRAEE